ncbi:hypothetical protein RHGRI_020165 [Rhododendron griersonianum]|uniref:Uncharacterized protein n=1 Tax=Rhododendron griersonianum TaxID=479676 RepID=A0AAV6JJ98_9ERIC|nr:hypothetical protein RHGRI_020165 [Rhododendron griersonianum]
MLSNSAVEFRLFSTILTYMRPSFTLLINCSISRLSIPGSATAILVSVTTGRAQQFGGSSASREGTLSLSNSSTPINSFNDFDFSRSCMRFFGGFFFPIRNHLSVASQLLSTITSINSSSPSRCKTKRLRCSFEKGFDSDPESSFVIP